MSDFAAADAAAFEALQAANAAPAEPAEPAQTVDPAPSEGVADAGAAPAEPVDSFTPINPDDLPEELQALARQLQGDYTRKTQALAEQRKAFEAFGDADPRQVLEAYEFTQNLQSDPQYALRVHQELTRALQAEGLTLGEAQAAAADAMQQEAEMEPWDMNEEMYGAVPPQIQQQLDQFAQFMQNYEQQMAQQNQINELMRQDAIIRQAHPEYTDAHMEHIAQLAPWYDGDLMKAEAAYSDMRSQFAAEYLGQKKAVPATAPSGGVQGQPVEPSPLLTDNSNKNFEAADDIAREMLRSRGLI
jgi:hypothetical protein